MPTRVCACSTCQGRRKGPARPACGCGGATGRGARLYGPDTRAGSPTPWGAMSSATSSDFRRECAKYLSWVRSTASRLGGCRPAATGRGSARGRADPCQRPGRRGRRSARQRGRPRWGCSSRRRPGALLALRPSSGASRFRSACGSITAPARTAPMSTRRPTHVRRTVGIPATLASGPAAGLASIGAGEEDERRSGQ